MTVEIRFGGIVPITRPSYQPRDKTIGSNFFDRISVAVIADDNTDGRDKQTITQMAGINNILSKRYLK